VDRRRLSSRREDWSKESPENPPDQGPPTKECYKLRAERVSFSTVPPLGG